MNVGSVATTPAIFVAIRGSIGVGWWAVNAEKAE